MILCLKRDRAGATKDLSHYRDSQAGMCAERSLLALALGLNAAMCYNTPAPARIKICSSAGRGPVQGKGTPQSPF